MATFTRETATIQEVYYRVPLAAGKYKYVRQPFNLIKFDDGSGTYIEPISFHGMSNYTWSDVNSIANASEWLVLDQPVSWTGITELG